MSITVVICADYYLETEKYAHVTFFFNGGREAAFNLEERCLVPSPKVATYDLKPDMSCLGVAEKMVEMIKSKKHPFVMCNFAPPDMVGHTGVYEAAVLACEATGDYLRRHLLNSFCSILLRCKILLILYLRSCHWLN